jgi:hypothetical protein
MDNLQLILNVIYIRAIPPGPTPPPPPPPEPEPNPPAPEPPYFPPAPNPPPDPVMEENKNDDIILRQEKAIEYTAEELKLRNLKEKRKKFSSPSPPLVQSEKPVFKINIPFTD